MSTKLNERPLNCQEFIAAIWEFEMTLILELDKLFKALGKILENWAGVNHWSCSVLRLVIKVEFKAEICVDVKPKIWSEVYLGVNWLWGGVLFRDSINELRPFDILMIQVFSVDFFQAAVT